VSLLWFLNKRKIYEFELIEIERLPEEKMSIAFGVGVKPHGVGPDGREFFRVSAIKLSTVYTNPYCVIAGMVAVKSDFENVLSL
jgi:hypothetical protein